MRRLLLAAAAVALLAAAVPAAARAATLDDRVYAVARRLMCPVCAGQTVAESDSAVAREMRDVIRAKLQAGETPEAILSFFVGQFGEGVLAEPPRRGLAIVLYAGPAVGVAGGLALAVLLIRRWTPGACRTGGPVSRAAAAPRPDAGGPTAPSHADDLARLSRELETRERF